MAETTQYWEYGNLLKNDILPFFDILKIGTKDLQEELKKLFCKGLDKQSTLHPIPACHPIFK